MKKLPEHSSVDRSKLRWKETRLTGLLWSELKKKAPGLYMNIINSLYAESEPNVKPNVQQRAERVESELQQKGSSLAKLKPLRRIKDGTLGTIFYEMGEETEGVVELRKEWRKSIRRLKELLANPSYLQSAKLTNEVKKELSRLRTLMKETEGAKAFDTFAAKSLDELHSTIAGDGAKLSKNVRAEFSRKSSIYKAQAKELDKELIALGFETKRKRSKLIEDIFYILDAAHYPRPTAESYKKIRKLIES